MKIVESGNSDIINITYHYAVLVKQIINTVNPFTFSILANSNTNMSHESFISSQHALPLKMCIRNRRWNFGCAHETFNMLLKDFKQYKKVNTRLHICISH